MMKKIFLLMLSIFNMLFVAVTITMASETTLFKKQAQDSSNKETKDSKILLSDEYTASKRRDPFIPLIVKPELKIKDIDLTVSQIKLLGIIWDNSNYYAVLLFPDGKYYNLKENMRLPMHNAFIHKITKDSVTIKKEIKTKKGAIKTEDIILKLRKEEEG